MVGLGLVKRIAHLRKRLRQHVAAQRARNAFDVRLHTAVGAAATLPVRRPQAPPHPATERVTLRRDKPEATVTITAPPVASAPAPARMTTVTPPAYFQLDIPLARLREKQLRDLLTELPPQAQQEARDAFRAGTAGILSALDGLRGGTSNGPSANESLRRWYLVALAFLADRRREATIDLRPRQRVA